MKTRICYLIPVLFILFSCGNDDNSLPTEEKTINLSMESKQMVLNDNQFGVEIFKRLIEVDSAKNMMISPLSMSQALLMAYNGAGGQTKTAFEEAMFLSGLTTEQINQAKKDLVEELLHVDPSVTLSVANSIWYREGFSVNPNFIKVNQDFYNAEVLEAPFDNTTVNLINSWVNDNTNGKIDKIIESIDPLAVMFLINAVYFYGNWKYKFDEAYTVNSDFNLMGGAKISTPFMNQQTTARFMRSDDFSLLEMPYGRGNFSMLIFLPHEDKSLNDIINQLNVEDYYNWLSDLIEMTVDISIPKFKFGYEKVLNDYLKALGLSVAFDSQNADFSEISDEMDLFISFVKHKSFIDVNEKGTEAAAVTIIGFETTSVPSYPQFIANRPFLFAIREKYTNSILFIGQVVNPSED